MRLILIASLLFLSFTSSVGISIDSVKQETEIEKSFLLLLNKERSNIHLDTLQRINVMNYACQYHVEYLYKLQKYLGSKESFRTYCKTQIYNEDQTHYENIDIPEFNELVTATDRLTKYTNIDNRPYECASVLYKREPFNISDANTIINKFMNSPSHKGALLMEKTVKEIYRDNTKRIAKIKDIGISINQIKYNINGVTEYAIVTVISTR
jgi:hypothetical protein